jgi:NAD(P)-dependent dehydrogenase (short-subunit alcohol dehydrogenase family)
MSGLTGLSALVTGGGRGIGEAVVRALAAEGVAVAVAARSTDQIEAVAHDVTRSGGRAVAVACDVTSTESVAKAFDQAVQTLGRVDILVNNAGVAGSAPLLKLEEDEWERHLAVNLTGTYRCTRAALPGMLERGFGRIINMASIAGRIGGAYISAYSASKHGVLGFTRSIALEVATKGITVNAVCPGYVESDMSTAAVARIAAATRRDPAEARRALEAFSPQSRLITPGEVATVVLFLASRDAHGITGQAINVDGGTVMA